MWICIVHHHKRASNASNALPFLYVGADLHCLVLSHTPAHTARPWMWASHAMCLFYSSGFCWVLTAPTHGGMALGAWRLPDKDYWKRDLNVRCTEMKTTKSKICVDEWLTSGGVPMSKMSHSCAAWCGDWGTPVLKCCGYRLSLPTCTEFTAELAFGKQSMNQQS